MTEIYPDTTMGRHEREISQLTAQNTALSEALRKADPEIERYKTERDEWHKLATDATRQREELREQLGEAARQRDDWKKSSDTFEATLRDVGKQRDEARDKLARALAANQRWAETLGDIQQAGRDSTPAQEPGEWGILELMGHRTAIGRISERELAGKPMLHVQRVDGITQWYSPDSLYALTPCTAEQAAEAARKQYQPGLPYGLRAITAASDDDEDDADPWHSDGGDRVAATPDGTPYPVERDGETF